MTSETIYIALATAVITALVTIKVQKDNYHREFYKKILDKRLDALELARALMGELAGTVVLPDGRECLIVMATDMDDYRAFKKRFFEVSQKTFWLGNQTSNLLTDLSRYLFENIEQNIHPLSNDKYFDLLELGVLHTSPIQLLKLGIEDEFTNDLTNMPKVKEFLQNKAIDSVPLELNIW